MRSRVSVLRAAATTVTTGTAAVPRVARNLPAAALQVNEEVMVERGEGAWIHATNGRKYLDLTSGIGVTSLGHCHPRIVKAVQAQAAKLLHGQINCYTHQPYMDLIDKMRAVLPRSLDSAFLANAGAESIENAIKLARHATGRPNVIVFQGGFHGRTLGAGALTTAKTFYRAGFQPTMPGVFVAPYAYCHRCPVRRGCGDADKFSTSKCCDYALENLNVLLKQQTAPFETAAILVEPVLGEGGYVAPSRSFMQGLRKKATEIGALLIADEVQSGYGRTGKFWGYEHFDVEPDMIVAAKGIATGLPLSALITRKDIMDKALPGSIGGTYGGNAVACAAAIEVLNVYKDEKIIDNVKARSKEFFAGLNKLKAKYPIADVRGLGLMIGVEFADSVAPGTASKVSKACGSNGMLVMTAGVFETLRLIPPLIINAGEVETAVGILDRSLAQVFGK